MTQSDHSGCLGRLPRRVGRMPETFLRSMALRKYCKAEGRTHDRPQGLTHDKNASYAFRGSSVQVWLLFKCLHAPDLTFASDI